VEFGIKWNDDSVTPILGSNPKEVIRIFMNSIKLKRLGIFTKDHFAVGIVSHTVEKKSAVKDEWLETAWESYSLTQADMLDLYRAG
jgi:hypothetical protein